MQSEHCYLSKLKRGEKTLAEYVKERGAIRPEGFFLKKGNFLMLALEISLSLCLLQCLVS